MISKVARAVSPPIVPPIETAPDPELISKSLAPLIVEAKSTVPPAVVNATAPPSVVTSLISILPPAVVIFPLNQITLLTKNQSQERLTVILFR